MKRKETGLFAIELNANVSAICVWSGGKNFEVATRFSQWAKFTNKPCLYG
jgi:hypothetical protein